MRPMSEAPADRSITLFMPDGAQFVAHLIPVEGDSGTVWTWAAAYEGTAPADWCDGCCWAINSDGVPSTQPVGWEEIMEGCANGLG